MEIIAVVDLIAGQVVRAIGGRRSEYRPIHSPLAASSAPDEVARALQDRFALRTAYVADLDAIGGAAPDFSSYAAIAQRGFALWIDLGVRVAADAKRAASALGRMNGQCSIVAGLETLAGPEALRETVAALGAERIVFSLDLRQGAPLGAVGAWPRVEPLAIAQAAVDCGVRRIVVLDLAQVGQSRGPGTIALCRSLRSRFRRLEIAAGGGIRGIDDLAALHQAGCTAALVASALHDGRLAPDEVARAQRWPAADGCPPERSR